jgi:hypothetical protein
MNKFPKRKKWPGKPVSSPGAEKLLPILEQNYRLVIRVYFFSISSLTTACQFDHPGDKGFEGADFGLGIDRVAGSLERFRSRGANTGIAHPVPGPTFAVLGKAADCGRTAKDNPVRSRLTKLTAGGIVPIDGFNRPVDLRPVDLRTPVAESFL